jgi:hypothetical protein
LAAKVAAFADNVQRLISDACQTTFQRFDLFVDLPK